MFRDHHILVIDDDPMFRTLLVSLLGREYHVAVASEGSEGFYRALENPPNLVLIDVRMPGWDGLRTLRAIRNSRVLANCRVMMLTGDDRAETISTAFQDGADAYLVKTDFSKDELQRKMASLLGLTPPAARRSGVPRIDTLRSHRHRTDSDSDVEAFCETPA